MVLSVVTKLWIEDQGRIYCGTARARIVAIAAGSPPVLGLVAIILGIVALVLRTRRKGMAITGILLPMLLLVIYVPFGFYGCY